MGVNFQATLLPHQRKSDGSNIIRIRVTHNGKSKWIKTNIVVSSSEQTKAGKPRSSAVMKPADKLIERMEKVVNDIDMYKLASMSVDDVVNIVNSELEEKEAFRLDFYEYGLLVGSRKSTGNAPQYSVAMNALLRFFKGRHPDISEITVRNLRAFEEFLSNEKKQCYSASKGKVVQLRKNKGKRAASAYLSVIKCVYRSARLEFNDPDLGLFPIPNNPFEYYTPPKSPAPKHRDVSPEVIQLMIDTRHQYTGRARLSIDAFLISFGLCGMNAADLYSCALPKKNILIYNRQKVAERRDDDAEMRVRIEPCIKEIMKEYKDTVRCFKYHRQYVEKDNFTSSLNGGLRIWQKDHKQQDFTFYSARHSWATIGASKLCGISKDIISMGLCHSNPNNKVDDIYIKKDWELLWEANKKILGLFKWE